MYTTLIVALWAYYEVIWNPPVFLPTPQSRLIRADDFRPAKCMPIRTADLDHYSREAKTLTLLALENQEDMLTPYHVGSRECYFVVNVAAAKQAPVYAAYLNPQIVEYRDFLRADHRDRLCGRRRLRHRFPKHVTWNWTNPLTLNPAMNHSTDIQLSTRLASAFHLLDGGDICQ